MANANGEISSDKLIDLRVVDLRNELDKRGLDKTGVKAVLLERLEQALKSEGESLGNTEENKEKSDTVSSKVTDLVKNEALSEEKFLEESSPAEDVIQNELSTDNMEEKEAETPNVALTDVLLNTNPDTESVLPVKTSVEDLTENQLLSSDTKPSDMLVNDTFDKDQFVEELPVTTLDTNKETILQEESDVPLKDTTAPPEQSSSSAETNTKEENSEISSKAENTTKEKKNSEESSSTENTTKDKKNSEESSSAENTTKDKKNSEESLSAENTTKDKKSEKSSVAENTVEEEKSEQSSSASVKIATPPLNSNERKDEEVAKTVLSDSLPPKPASVPRKAPFALKATISMDTSTTQQSEENESLIVHVDDTQNDLDADLVASKTNKAKMDKTSKEKVSGKTEVKKTDGSTVEERSKGKTEGGQTEKKADEKKDDKDVKSKSSPVSKPKVVKNIKSNNQNSRNLWISGLAASTRATDLKMLCIKYGKVVGAKVVTNARSPGARCYGFVTMSTAHEASKCIQYLNKTELHGRMISVEKARNEPGSQIIKMAETKTAEKKVEKTEVKKDEKKDGDKKEGVKKVDKKEPKKDDKDRRLPSRRDDKDKRMPSRRNEKDRRVSGRRDDKRHISSSSSSRHRTSDKPRMATLNKNTGKPVTTSLKRATKEGSEKGTKPSSSANTKEKVSNTQKPKPGGPTATSETVKDKNGKDIKKDILSFDQIKKERELQRKRQRRRRLREEERHQNTNLDRAHLLKHDFDQEKALRLEKVREHLRTERQELEKVLLQRERYKLEQEFLAEMMRVEEIRHSIKRPYDRSNRHEEELWVEPKRPSLSSSSNPSRFELPFQNESRYNEYELTDDDRRIERYERRESRAALESGSRFDERKEREMMRREVGHVRNIRDRDERRTEDRSRTDEKLTRMPFELRRDVGPSVEPERRYIGPDRGQDTDRQNISAHDRLGRVRSSLVGEPDQRLPWGSGSIVRKVDSWSHMHRDMDNSGMSRPSDRWPGNPMNTTGRDSTGAFVDHRRPGNSGGMMQNLGHTNMFGNSQSQSGIMMVTHGGGGGGGGGNMSGRMQETRFDAYKNMGSM